MNPNNSVLGKKDKAPLNRSTFLTQADVERFAHLLSVADVAGKSWDELLNTIFVGDCLEGMRQLPSECVDFVFADPPYNLGKNFGNNLDRRPNREYRAWCAAWIGELHRLVKPTASVYVCCDWFYSGMFQELLSQHFIIQNRITWKREKGRGAKTNWKNNMEDIWFSTASDDYKFYVERVKVKKEVITPYRENGKPKDWTKENGERYRWTHPSNIWTDLVVPFRSMPENAPHPTQKPERLVERALLASSDEGDIVLDPFMGSGTTAMAATRLKRPFIGFELKVLCATTFAGSHHPRAVAEALHRQGKIEGERTQPAAHDGDAVIELRSGAGDGAGVVRAQPCGQHAAACAGVEQSGEAGLL